jgi:hypothetical protein
MCACESVGGGGAQFITVQIQALSWANSYEVCGLSAKLGQASLKFSSVPPANSHSIIASLCHSRRGQMNFFQFT